MISKSVDYYFYKEFIKSQTDSTESKEEDEEQRIVKLPFFAPSLRAQLLNVREQVGGLRFLKRRTKSESESTELDSIETEY